MGNPVPNIDLPRNEPVLSYAPGSPERATLKAELARMAKAPLEIPLVIGGEEVRTGNIFELRAPHDHDLLLARVHVAGAKETTQAIDAALSARAAWARMPWYQRAAIFLKAADLLAGKHRALNNAATMLGQSKSAYQAEIDSACEQVDFWRFNSYYARRLYEDQPPHSPTGVWNRTEMRGLEGFVFAISPFNFTSIGANLPTAPAIVGNVAVWKPSPTQMLSAWTTMQILQEAGLPPGVINLIVDGGDAKPIGDTALQHPDLAGVHFTGSTGTCHMIFETIGKNVRTYRTYPRVVAETGGKDFVVVHPSADVPAVSTALVRGAFEYQGQKCSAASRAYVPQSLWPALRERLVQTVEGIRMGSPLDFTNFMNAVIDDRAFDKITGYIEKARNSPDAEVVVGGESDRSKGWFVRPTVILAKTPDFVTMREEIFGPVLTVYVYPDAEWERTLELCDQGSPYALTGAVFAQDRRAIEVAERALEHAAGNFYINDKPTGAVVGQQPFGGGRASGTNDKAGSWLNLVRWVSVRTIKETFDPPAGDYRYPFMGAE